MVASGEGTNLKFWGRGGTSGAKRPKKILVLPVHFLGSSGTISRLVESFCDGQYTVWPVSCLLFFYSRCPPCPAICTSVGGHVFPVPYGVGPGGANGVGRTNLVKPRRARLVPRFGGSAIPLFVRATQPGRLQWRQRLGNLWGWIDAKGKGILGDGSHPLGSRGEDPIRGLVNEPPS